MQLIWTLPVSTEPRGASAPAARDVRAGRFDSLDHLEQVARAAQAGGFDGVLVPYDPTGDDSWVAATAVARLAQRLGVVVEYATTFATPVYAAKMAATFQAFTHGRLAIKPLSGERLLRSTPVSPDETARQRTAEYLEIGRGLWETTDYSFSGKVFDVARSGLIPKLTRYPRPTVVLSGQHADELDLSAREADVHLFDLPADGRVAPLVDDLAARAAALGRSVTAGVRLGVLARPDDDEARAALGGGATSTGVIQSGLEALGYSSPTGLVGSYRRVAAALESLQRDGIGTVVLEGLPHLEEAYRFAEAVRPLADLDPVPALAV